MSNIKSLILGSAASVVAFAGAQAADLPVKAKAVQYVKICSLYGAGFYYIPGTETCLKIGGYVRAETIFGYGGGSHVQRWNSDDGLRTRNGDNVFMRARANVSFDTRTATEYGVVRTFYLHDIYFNTGSADYNPANVTSSQWGGTVIANAFVQFAGFTFGKTAPVQQPQFAMPISGSGLNGFADYSAPNTGELTAYYTAELGNGLSISFGFADQTWGRNPVYDTTLPIQTPFTSATGFAGSTQGGQTTPDFVANVKFDQAWGGIFGSVRVRDLGHTYFATSSGGSIIEANGHANDVVAFGANGGFQLKNLPTGPGDTFTVLGSYGDGITNITGSQGPQPSFVGLRGIDGRVGTLGVGYILDAVTNQATGRLIKTKSYGVQAGFEHYWVPGKLRTSLFGGYEVIDYDGTANALLLAAATRGAAAGGLGLANSNGNFDVRIAQAGSRSIWTPVSGLDFIAEVLYTRFDLPLTGTIVAGAVNNFQAVGTAATLTSQNALTGMLRVQRNF